MAKNRPHNTKPGAKRQKQNFVGIIYSCCKIYGRVYLPPGKAVVFGFCPKCGARTEIHQSPTGSTNLFFTAR